MTADKGVTVLVKQKNNFHLFSNKDKLLKTFVISHITAKIKKLIYASVEEKMKRILNIFYSNSLDCCRVTNIKVNFICANLKKGESMRDCNVQKHFLPVAM
jgi:hypothetical protein